MDRRRAWWGYLKRWLETVTWVLARSTFLTERPARNTLNARRRSLVTFGSLLGRSVGLPSPGVVESFLMFCFVALLKGSTIANLKRGICIAGDHSPQSHVESCDEEQEKKEHSRQTHLESCL